MNGDEHGHQSGWTEESWDAWRDYADRVTVEIRFKPWLGADDADEAWLIETDGAAWSKDWLLRQLTELAVLDGPGGCSGTGTYLLDVHEHTTEWGASASVWEAVLTLGESLLANGTWVAVGALATKLASQLREKRSDWSADQEALIGDEVRRSAAGAVQRLRGVPSDDLEVRSVELPSVGGALVELQEVASGRRYAVEVRRHSGGVRVARVRKVTEPH